MLTLLCLALAVDARWQQKPLDAKFSVEPAGSQSVESNKTSSLVQGSKVEARKNGKLYPVNASTEDDGWKDEVLGEGEAVINQYGSQRGQEVERYQPQYEPDTSYRPQYGASERSGDPGFDVTSKNPGSVESEVSSEQRLESSQSTTTNASASTSSEGSTTSSLDPTAQIPGGLAQNSGPFGVSIGTWIIIGIVLLLVLIALFFIRKYIRAIVGCLETSCYWTCKAISFPFFILWSALQAMAYPVKEFCVHTRQAIQEYWHPWSVVT